MEDQHFLFRYPIDTQDSERIEKKRNENGEQGRRPFRLIARAAAREKITLRSLCDAFRPALSGVAFFFTTAQINGYPFIEDEGQDHSVRALEQ